jgi:hypothetical protein
VEALGEASSHRFKSKRLTLLGERSGACDAVERATIAVLLMDVLTGLGGASQEKSAARNFFGSIYEEARRTAMSSALFVFAFCI